MRQMTPEQMERFQQACLQLKENNPKLEWLDLRYLNIGDVEVGVLVEVLRNNTTLKNLNLSGNQIGYLGAQKLAQLVSNGVLEKLNLGSNHLGNQIGDEGAMAIASALGQNKSLVWLSLHENQIKNKGAHALASALEYNHTLKLLSLFHNFVGQSGGAMFERSVSKNAVIQELFLQKNEVDLATQSAIETQLKLNRRLARVRSGNSSLIDITGVDLSSEKRGVLEVLCHKYPQLTIMDAGKENTGLSVLNLLQLTGNSGR